MLCSSPPVHPIFLLNSTSKISHDAGGVSVCLSILHAHVYMEFKCPQGQGTLELGGFRHLWSHGASNCWDQTLWKPEGQGLQPVPGWALCVCACAGKGNLSIRVAGLRQSPCQVPKPCRTLRASCQNRNLYFSFVFCTYSFCSSGLCPEQPEGNRMWLMYLAWAMDFSLPELT